MKRYVLLLITLAIRLEATQIMDLKVPEFSGLYEKFEICFQVDANYENPFNPDEVLIDGLFQDPDGRVLRVPAFWYQDFMRSLNESTEVLTPISDPDWRIRFAPIQTGAHRFQIEITDQSGITLSDPVSFIVDSSSSKGFIRVDADDPQHMSFDNGDLYFPMGMNVGWARAGGSYDYDRYMSRMGESNQNWIRIWSCHFYNGQLLEWEAGHSTGWYHGLGRYSQQGAWMWDHYVQQAEQFGLHIQLVTQHHGQFSQRTNSNWNECPYNQDLGGMLESGAEFFTNEEAKALYKHKLRYTVARWGYSPAILAWELFNEVQWTDNYQENYPNVAAWHEEMANYLHSIDPWRHLVTTSARDGDGLIWGNDAIDINQVHFYGAGVSDALRHRNDMMMQYGKPCIIGEYGDNSQTGGADQTGTFIHDGIWGTALVGGGAMPWWWDNLIEPNNLYYHWTGFAAFWKDEDLRTGNFQVIPVSVSGGPNSAMAIQMTPGKEWEASTEHEFYINADWDAPGIGNLSKYIQGSSKPDMGREAVFHALLNDSIVFGVNIGAVSSIDSGHLQVYLDEIKTPLLDLTPSPGQRYYIEIPKGAHKIRVFNAGVDWYRVDHFEIEGATRPAAKGWGLSNGRTTYLWIRDMDYRLGQSPHTTLSSVRVTVPGLEPGTYSIEQWHTTEGRIMKTRSLQVEGDLILSLGDFYMDAAVKIKKTD